MTGWRIRAGREDDAADLIAIERRASALLIGHSAHALFASHTLPASMHAEAARSGRLWVAECDEHAVGYVLYERAGDVAHLLQMDVDPAHGRRGIGRALLEHACARAASEGLSAMVLTTLADVPWNAPFYARAGFHVLDEAEWTPHLRSVMEQERALGFPMHLRVVMRRTLVTSSGGQGEAHA